MIAWKNSYFIYLFLIVIIIKIVSCVEFTYDLPDNYEECFFEEIKNHTPVYLEYQVTSGGQLDIDVTLLNPKNEIIFKQERSSSNTHDFVSDLDGVYAACFSNKFSTFSHKFVYIDFQVGEEPHLPGIGEHATVLSKMDTAAESIHKSLNEILDAQTHHRIREAIGRKRAEELNERVLWWSVLETSAILFIAIGQVLILRNFFTDRKPIKSTQYT